MCVYVNWCVNGYVVVKCIFVCGIELRRYYVIY